MSEQSSYLVFVYNTNMSVFGLLIDFLHKTFNPTSYRCGVCRITYGFGTKQDWRKFLYMLPYQTIFYRREEFVSSFPQFADLEVPAVFIQIGDHFKQIISAGEIETLSTIEEIKLLLLNRLTSPTPGATQE